MLSFDGNQTELVEIPVIIVDSKVSLIDPLMKTVDIKTLHDMAYAMDGHVGYLKVRAHYEVLEQDHCTYKNCWRPVVPGTDRCDSPGHPVR